MMSWLVCADAPEEYVPMVLEEMELEGRDARASTPPGSTPTDLFCMYGPGTNLAHGGSLIFHSECQMRYIGGCLRALIAGGHRAMEPTRAAYEDYYARTQKELETLVWSHPSIEHSWYKNAEGKIHILYPWRLADYWSWTKQPDLHSFAFS
jgi:4-hydroxyacetophenone monooxygenase